jgi:hypothetical protein
MRTRRAPSPGPSSTTMPMVTPLLHQAPRQVRRPHFNTLDEWVHGTGRSGVRFRTLVFGTVQPDARVSVPTRRELTCLTPSASSLSTTTATS